MTPERRKYYAGIGEYEANMRGMLMGERRELKRHKKMMNEQLILSFDEKNNVFEPSRKAVLESIRIIKHLIKTYKKALPKHWPEGKLKPCPFCGARGNDVRLHVKYDKKIEEEMARIKCFKCALEIGWFHGRNNALKAWNTRSGK